MARVLAVVAAIALCGYGLFHWVWRPVHCNAEITALDAQTDLAAETGNDYDRTVRARNNLARLAALRESCAAEVRVPVMMAANDLLLGNADDAARHYEEALRIEERPEIEAALARVEVQQGKLEQGIERYVRVARFQPAILQELGDEELYRRITARLRL
ncbi:MAG TPA: hypothetical protein VND45_08490 [Thermoanaerobaculia bacterium]|jgi:tetratricopeptide (TPR) repeat protein|nr:hypothetical protein [Thermoanaerobaculia bacterium]